MDPRRNLKLAVVGGIALAAVVAVSLIAPIPQDAGYHNFADRRAALGIPNFADVATDLPFVVVGVLALVLLARGAAPGGLPELRAAYVVFFLGVTLVGFGSGFYHLRPSNATLLWDRLPMTMAFMAFLSAVAGENISVRLGRRMLLPLVVVGIATVIYWYASETRGHGDLRPYALVQLLPMAVIPVILILFRSSLTKTWYLWAVLGAYGAAKAAECLDAAAFQFTGALSGHSLKHLLAALGAALFAAALRNRRRRASAAQAAQGRAA
jgi:hypothetical protein